MPHKPMNDEQDWNSLNYQERKLFAESYGLRISGTWQPQAERIFNAVAQARKDERKAVIEKIKEIIGDEEPFNIERKTQLEEKVNRDLRGVINDKIAARNIFRAEQREKLAQLEKEDGIK